MNEVRELPSDVWVEILRRIAAADLIPLKAVCKTFHRLISDDFFTRLHINHFIKLHPKVAKAIIIPRVPIRRSHSYYYDPNRRTISVWHEPRFGCWCNNIDTEPRFGCWCNNILPIGHYDSVVDSYHGLLLVQMCDRILLYNPITTSYKVASTNNFRRLGCWKIAYDDVWEQYKVFSLEFRPTNMVSVYVFDVLRNEAMHYPRIKTAMDSQNMNLYYGDNVLVNGSVYWLFITKEPETLNGEKRWMTCIISANVTTEEVKTRSCNCFIKCFGHDIFAANGTFYQLETNYFIKIWVLEGVESENPNPSWTMKHIIDRSHLTSALSINPNFYICDVVGVFCNIVLFIMRSHHCPYQLFQYDMSSKEVEEISGSNHNIVWIMPSRIIEHIDSLIKP